MEHFQNLHTQISIGKQARMCEPLPVVFSKQLPTYSNSNNPKSQVR